MPTVIVQCNDLDSIAERLSEALGILIETVVERQVVDEAYLLNDGKDAKV